MRRKLTLTFVGFLQFLFLYAQNHDYVWLFGYSSNTIDSTFGGSVINFNSSPPDVYYEFREMRFRQTNVSMCDSLGNLLFYSNGSYVANVHGDTMLNCTGLNPGPAHETFRDYGYILDQGITAIPVPESDHMYYLIHLDRIPPHLDPIHGSHFFYYTLVDMSLANGLGAVVEENVVVLEDDLGLGKLTTVRHANGRDWWVLIRKYDSNEYYRVLISDESVDILDNQIIGEPLPNVGGLGQSVFSPDGTKYVHYGTISHVVGSYLNIYDFDRCTGELSNPIQIHEIDSSSAGGVAISPNSRFLYVLAYNYIYQYDFWADDFIASKDTVAIYDGFLVNDFFHTRFSLGQLAPDGKIYITSSGAVPYLTVINNPDLPSDSCDVCQHCVELPTFNAWSMPNFPNYRLGASEEPCIPDAVEELEIASAKLEVYPNPANMEVTVRWGEVEFEKGELLILDALGQIIIKKGIGKGFDHEKINIEHLESGVYFVHLKLDNKNSLVQKIIKL